MTFREWGKPNNLRDCCVFCFCCFSLYFIFIFILTFSWEFQIDVASENFFASRDTAPRFVTRDSVLKIADAKVNKEVEEYLTREGLHSISVQGAALSIVNTDGKVSIVSFQRNGVHRLRTLFTKILLQGRS